jgi:hypothetical protein
MENAQKMVRSLITLVAVFFFFGAVSGCASYSPKKNGICNHDRVWVAPAKGAEGEMKAGYCKDAN